MTGAGAADTNSISEILDAAGRGDVDAVRRLVATKDSLVNAEDVVSVMTRCLPSFPAWLQRQH